MSRALNYLFLLALFSVGLTPSVKAQQEGIVFKFFNITPDRADILLEWEIQDESPIIRFEIVRKFNNEGTFKQLAELDVNGTGSYKYLDDDIFKNNSRTLHYELHVITESETLKFPKSLLHSPTSIQRTWGSIKAMFR